MSPSRSKTLSLLSVGSAVFGGMAIVCSMLFLVSPKGDIAVFMAYSLLGRIGASAVSLTLGILGLIFSRGKSNLLIRVCLSVSWHSPVTSCISGSIPFGKYLSSSSA